MREGVLEREVGIDLVEAGRGLGDDAQWRVHGQADGQLEAVGGASDATLGAEQVVAALGEVHLHLQRLHLGDESGLELAGGEQEGLLLAGEVGAGDDFAALGAQELVELRGDVVDDVELGRGVVAARLVERELRALERELERVGHQQRLIEVETVAVEEGAALERRVGHVVVDAVGAMVHVAGQPDAAVGRQGLGERETGAPLAAAVSGVLRQLAGLVDPLHRLVVVGGVEFEAHLGLEAAARRLDILLRLDECEADHAGVVALGEGEIERLGQGERGRVRRRREVLGESGRGERHGAEQQQVSHHSYLRDSMGLMRAARRAG